jgi:hypothetical protein
VYTEPDVASKILKTRLRGKSIAVASPAIAQVVARAPVWMAPRTKKFATLSDFRKPLRDFRRVRTRKTIPGVKKISLKNGEGRTCDEALCKSLNCVPDNSHGLSHRKRASDHVNVNTGSGVLA